LSFVEKRSDNFGAAKLSMVSWSCSGTRKKDEVGGGWGKEGGLE
jgi:hypothetical protein